MNQIYQVDSLPVLQNRVFDTEELAKNCATGPLKLVQNVETGLIYNAAFDPNLIVYDQNYNNEQSLSPSFQLHLKEVQAIVSNLLGTKNLLEVGCGKGYFLELLRSSGFDVSGCDPTYEGNNPDIIQQFYNSELAISGKNIILRHVLEHIPDPVTFLQAIADTNRGGRIYIEVPCLDWIAANNAWFDLFYEHVNYFRLNDLEAMFGNVINSGRLFGGQYLYIVAELSTVRSPSFRTDDNFRLPDEFRPDFRALSKAKKIAIWGAASKGVIYSLQAMQNGIPIECAIDVNPAKHGKYLPVTGIKVLAPEVANESLPSSAYVVIMNSNYSEEIRQMSMGKFNYLVAENEK
jgi:hypothetical protein